MAVCDKCGKEVALPYNCSYCGKNFCGEHRLPENHDCKGSVVEPLKKELIRRETAREEGSVETRPFTIRYDFDTSRPLERQRRRSRSLLPRASMAILVIIAIVFIAQLVAQLALGSGYYRLGDHSSFIYYLATSGATVIERPWTLITSLFAHGGFLHIMFNGLVFLSFGPILEVRIGSKRFVGLFLISGALAGLVQLAFMNPEIILLGASGAILGVLGALTVLMPEMPVLLFFFLPLKLWMATLGFGILSALLAVFEVGGSVANVAHFAGLIIGLAYGFKLKKEEKQKQNNLAKKLLGSFYRANF